MTEYATFLECSVIEKDSPDRENLLLNLISHVNTCVFIFLVYRISGRNTSPLSQIPYPSRSGSFCSKRYLAFSAGTGTGYSPVKQAEQNPDTEASVK